MFALCLCGENFTVPFLKEEAFRMRSFIVVIVFLSTLLFAICPAYAYVYFVEAENFDPDNSEPLAAGCTWTTVEIEDENIFNESYVLYSGPHAGANTSLLYPIPDVSKSAGPWMVWVRCIMPDGGSDSYFFYVSTDAGDDWGPQQTAHGSGTGEDWKWEGWALNTPLEKGNDNVLKISERENAKADVICVRNDGVAPTDEEYVTWQEEYEEGKIAVEPLRKLTTTWGNIK
jgi:hypothetical protein